MDTGSFPEGMRPESWLTTLSLQSRRRVLVELYSYLSFIPAWHVTGQLLPLLRIITKKML